MSETALDVYHGLLSVEKGQAVYEHAQKQPVFLIIKWLFLTLWKFIDDTLNMLYKELNTSTNKETT